MDGNDLCLTGAKRREWMGMIYGRTGAKGREWMEMIYVLLVLHVGNSWE